METNYALKENAVCDTPLLLFDCVFGDGRTEHWSSHQVTIAQTTYQARVQRQNIFEMQLGSDLGVDSIPRISIDLANADSYFSELDQSVGFKGAQIAVSMAFYNFPSGGPSSASQILFRGILNAPELITEQVLKLTALNRLSLQRTALPDTRVQKRCPWSFPSSPGQRAEAVQGGTAGKYSRFYRCGYSPDFAGGVGNLAGDGTAFTSCSYTRSDCTARGMFQRDLSGNTTSRFGGIEFVPPSITVRSAGEKGSHASPLQNNESRYNDFVPLTYGTAWISPGIVFSRNDGNLTHLELLLGAGQLQAVQKVIVNSIEIPPGQNGTNMTGTGWFNVVSLGTRNGSFNVDFSDGHGIPLGDPYGSMAFLSVVVPNRINDGSSLPSVQVLVDGLILPQFENSGVLQGESFTNNPAWVILDLLRRMGWALQDLDLVSFATTAQYCQEAIQTTDLFGKPIETARFQCNLVLKNRRSAADVVRGIRNANRLMLRYSPEGLLQLLVENTIALQQPNPSAFTNAKSSLNGGWPAYEFGDGTNGTSGIARTSSGASSVRLSSRQASETPNRFSAEFQDAFNEYQQDSLSIVNSDDVAATGMEITSSTPVLGFPHFDQAARILKCFLDKSIDGNRTIEFETSVKALGLTPGDIVSVTYAKEGLQRQPFRLLRVQPGTNYRTAHLIAQIHDDQWYSDANGQTSADASRRQGASGIGMPRPISGISLDSDGNLSFGVVESTSQTPDGAVQVVATVSFSAPRPTQSKGPDIPLVSLSPVISSGGSIGGGQDLFYAVSCDDSGGAESHLSFIVDAHLPPGPATNLVTLKGLNFPPTATVFQVYRGSSPSNLTQVASNQPISNEFTDPGLMATSVLPADSNYDHSNFYWRLELMPPVTATTFGSTSIGSSILQMDPDTYAGMVVRIVSGSGVGQERVVQSNTNDVIVITPSWDIAPDSTSQFVVAQSTYQFGALAPVSPAQFTIPNQAGNVIHVLGRSANAMGVECPYEVSPLTRWTIGGAGITNIDSAPPSVPNFGVTVPDNVGGTLLFGAVGFQNLNNLSTATAGSYTLTYIDELNPASLGVLGSPLDAEGTTVLVTPAVAGNSPQYLLIDQEIVLVTGVAQDGTNFNVKRGAQGSVAASHQPGTDVVILSQRVVVVPFPKGFFGSPASGDWSYSLGMPNVKVVSAQLTVTNSQGASEPAYQSFTGLRQGGLRTLSGGQLSFQVGGFLAVQTNAAPNIIVDAPKVIRDAYAIVQQPPIGAPITLSVMRNGNSLFALTIPDGQTTSLPAIDGSTLPPMFYQDTLSLNINGVGQAVPGSGLTVIIRV